MPKFSGGTKIDSKKYLSITAGPLRYKRVHILVAEAMLGRKLHPDETVHHRDFDFLNPCWTNLKVLSRADHGAVSNRQKWFLNNREMHELKQWREWIETGGDRPDKSRSESEIDEQVILDTTHIAEISNHSSVMVVSREDSGDHSDGQAIEIEADDTNYDTSFTGETGDADGE